MIDKPYNGKAIYKPKGKAGEYSEWACNFFTGCSHNCSYCYCKRGVLSHAWSDEPRLKKSFKDEDHAISIFQKELMANLDELREKGLFFSFTTDPMIPGKTLELTLRAAKIAIDNDVPVQILTKRSEWWHEKSWHRFIDKAKDDKKLGKIAVGFTLTGRDDLEPGASINQQRIRAMRLCWIAEIHTFASIEPIVDIESSERMMEECHFWCELFKVGLMSNGTKPNKDELIRMMDKWNNILDKKGKKVYWKQSVRDYLGDDFTFNPDSCVNADYNIFIGQ